MRNLAENINFIMKWLAATIINQSKGRHCFFHIINVKLFVHGGRNGCKNLCKSTPPDLICFYMILFWVEIVC